MASLTTPADDIPHAFEPIDWKDKWSTSGFNPAKPDVNSIISEEFEREAKIFTVRLKNLFHAQGCDCRIQELFKPAEVAMVTGLQKILTMVVALYPRTPKPKTENVTLEQVLNLQKTIAEEAERTLLHLDDTYGKTAHKHDRMKQVIEDRLENAKEKAYQKIRVALEGRCNGFVPELTEIL